MARYLEPSTSNIRKPTDAAQDNGQVINPPRFAQLGGLDKPSRIAKKNPLTIRKPGNR